MNVPLLDLKAQFAQIRAEVMPLIEQVCTTQQFILGENVRGFEEEIHNLVVEARGASRPAYRPMETRQFRRPVRAHRRSH